MSRNFGLNGDRAYMNIRPKGCECQTWRQAEGCYNYCYQDIARPTAPRDLGAAGLACVVLLIIFAFVVVLWPSPSPKQCPPVWQCNGSKETNHPDCYARACER